MNTRNRRGMANSYDKLGIRASQSQVIHDLQQMTNKSMKDLEKRSSQQSGIFEYPERQKVISIQRRRKPSKLPDTVSAVLGFASLMNQNRGNVTKLEPDSHILLDPQILRDLIANKELPPPFRITQTSQLPLPPVQEPFPKL